MCQSELGSPMCKTNAPSGLGKNSFRSGSNLDSDMTLDNSLVLSKTLSLSPSHTTLPLSFDILV